MEDWKSSENLEKHIFLDVYMNELWKKFDLILSLYNE
jgi:hypothetical protein